ncbi:hypothetical protein V7138_06005 [Bacillus sp. JJ1533]|uniref:hypothetical protein n=1 Tax=Bacillus sp. JJ1533 TaxID=3122959 RepID=UPI002FFE0440
MIRALKSFIYVLVLLALFACSTDNAGQKDGVLTPVKQNERNSQIINSLGFDPLLMYELEVKSNDIKIIHVWVEHYKDGEKQDDLIKGSTATSETMTLAYSKLDFNLDENTTYAQWTISVADGTTLSTFESTPTELKDNLGMGQTWVDDKTIIEAEKPITLSLSVRNSRNGVGIGLGDDVIENAIKDSEEVFVVKAMISKQEEFFD